MTKKERLEQELLLKEERIAFWERYHSVPRTLDQYYDEA